MRDAKKILAAGLLGTAGLVLHGCALQPPTADPPAAPPAPQPVVALAPVSAPLPVAPSPTLVVPAPTPAPAPAAADDVVIVSTILSELSKAIQAGGELLRREIATANGNWTRVKSDATRLKLAGLVALASAGPADDARALSLLEPWLGKNAEANAYKAAADLISIPLLEKQRLMREEAKKSDAAREKADQLKKELDATTQKLEALRQLERNLGRRRTP
jgi:hypothetical protein